MEDLFTNLHRYRTRDSEKSNLEDWLTECLAAVLRSLSSPQWHELLTIVAGYEAAEAALLLSASIPQVRTQVDAGACGRPDLVIFFRDCPVIVLENKVAHGIGQGDPTEPGSETQLHRYARWLHENCSTSMPRPSLGFISHITPPPDDFSAYPAPADGYRGLARFVENWGGIGRFLLHLSKDEPASLQGALARAFYGMLKDQDMENEFPTTTDIAATQVFLAHESTVRNLVSRMWKKASSAASSTNMSAMLITPQAELGRYGAYRYVNRNPALRSVSIFIETGLWFPEVGDGWERSELENQVVAGPQAYLLYGSDDDDVFEDIEGRPSDTWLRPYKEFLVLRPLDTFAGTPDERTNGVLQWLEVETSNLRRFLLEKQLAT